MLLLLLLLLSHLHSLSQPVFLFSLRHPLSLSFSSSLFIYLSLSNALSISDLLSLFFLYLSFSLPRSPLFVFLFLSVYLNRIMPIDLSLLVADFLEEIGNDNCFYHSFGLTRNCYSSGLPKSFYLSGYK